MAAHLVQAWGHPGVPLRSFCCLGVLADLLSVSVFSTRLILRPFFSSVVCSPIGPLPSSCLSVLLFPVRLQEVLRVVLVEVSCPSVVLSS